MSDEVILNGLHQISLSGRVAKGVNCTIKAIIKGKAKCVFLSENSDKNISEIIKGLCKKHNVPLHSVPNKELLGKSLGLTCLRSNGTVRRQINCATCAIIKYGSVVTTELEEFRKQFALDAEEAQ